MLNRSQDAVFLLVKSLEKAEKRNFKLFVGRNTADVSLKIVQLFDALDKMNDYDEAVLLRKTPSIKKEQLPNQKAHLYKQILASLRVMQVDKRIEIQLHEQMEYAQILYEKGLYPQSLKLLDRAKEMAKQYHQHTFLLQVLVFEKKIESLHITRSMQNRSELLAAEVVELHQNLNFVGALSNLSLQLYSWFIHVGHARNEKDVLAIHAFFAAKLPPDAHKNTSFYGRLYLYQAQCWYAFIVQDFLLYYRYAQKWTDLFENELPMRRVETSYFIKGVHNLLLAHFMTRNYQKYDQVLRVFEDFAADSDAQVSSNVEIQTFVYLHLARINGHFMRGTFSEGLGLVADINLKLNEYQLKIDRHRVLGFYYKIACLYFGSGDPSTAIDYLNRIINWRVDLRSDLQCYARLLHLIAHYDLGNSGLIEHLIKSVFRFMAKMENLSVVEEEIFRFLRKSSQFNSQKRIRAAFCTLRDKLKTFEANRFESRSFIYLDIIAWLDSKIENIPIQAVIRRRYLKQGVGH